MAASGKAFLLFVLCCLCECFVAASSHATTKCYALCTLHFVQWEMKEYLSDEDHELFLDIVGGHRNVDFSEPEWKQARGKGIADLQ